MFEYRIDARKVSPTVFAVTFSKALRQKALHLPHDAVKEKVESIECPLHGKCGRGFRHDTQFVVTGCCDLLQQKVKRAF